MAIFAYKNQNYKVDANDFLLDFNDWDPNFAEGMAPKLNMRHGLTKEQWDVIHFIHNSFKETGKCPLVYETCQGCGFRLKELRKLFPTGYLRGACKLAGISSKAGQLGPAFHPSALPQTSSFMKSYDKTYEVDVRGFLVNPDDWDEHFAVYRAYDMKINDGKLTDKHWQVIKFLRENYEKRKSVPTVYETCEAIGLEIEDLEQLFPGGYHRSAVKIAGLRVS